MGRGAAKGQSAHRKLVLTAQLPALPVKAHSGVSSLQKRQTHSPFSAEGFVWEWCLIYTYTTVHTIKPKSPSSSNLPWAKWENHSHMSAVCAPIHVAERRASVWMENYHEINGETALNSSVAQTDGWCVMGKQRWAVFAAASALIQQSLVHRSVTMS